MRYCRVEKGAHFGELALMNNDPRAADIVAMGEVRVLAMAKEDFVSIVGKLKGTLEDEHAHRVEMEKAKKAQV